jgi:hypothetical protein
LIAESGNCQFEMRIRVRPGPGCGMPLHLIGGDVPCCVGAREYLTAVRIAVESLPSRGYVFEDLVNQLVRQLDPSEWDEYLQQEGRPERSGS